MNLDSKKVIIMLCIGVGLTPDILSPYINIFFWVIAVLLSKKGDLWYYEFSKRRKGVK